MTICEKCNDEDESCQECCDHRDKDNHCCLQCGKDLTEEIMSRAYDQYKDRMKYGE